MLDREIPAALAFMEGLKPTESELPIYTGIVDLIKLQIPLQPAERPYGDSHEIVCPNKECQVTLILEEVGCNHCSCCGQRLDWYAEGPIPYFADKTSEEDAIDRIKDAAWENSEL